MNMKTPFFLFFTSVLLFSLGGLLYGATSAELYIEAKKEFDNKNYEKSLHLFSLVIKGASEEELRLASLYYNGLSNFFLGKKSEAINIFGLLQTRNREKAFGFGVKYWLGMAYFKQGNAEKAIEHFLSQTGITGNGAADYLQESHYALSQCYFKLKNYAKAEEHLLLLDGDLRRQNSFHIASISMKLGHYLNAYHALNVYLADGGDSQEKAQALFFKGECAYKLGRYEEAHRLFGTYKKIRSTGEYTAPTLFRLIQIARERGSYSEVIDLYNLLKSEKSSKRWIKSIEPIVIEANYYVGEREKAAQMYDVAARQISGKAAKERYQFNRAIALFDKWPEEGLRILASLRNSTNHEIKEAVFYNEGKHLAASPLNQKKALDSLLTYHRVFPQGRHRNAVIKRILTIYLSDRNLYREEIVGFIKGILEREEHPLLRGNLFLALGELHDDEGDEFEALRNYYKVVETVGNYTPISFNALYRIGYIYNRRGEFERAFDYFKHIIDADAESGIIHRTLLACAICKNNVGRYDEATLYFDALAAMESNDGWSGFARVQKGMSLYYMGRYEESLSLFQEAYSEAFELEVKNAAAFWEGWSLYRLRDYQGARRVFHNLSMRSPEFYPGEALFRAGYAMETAGDSSMALSYYDQAERAAILNDSLRTEILSRIIRINLLAGNNSEALAALKELQRVEKDSPLGGEAFLQAGENFFFEGEYGKALDVFNLLSNVRGADEAKTTSLYLMGMSQMYTGKDKAAVNSLLAYLEKNAHGSHANSCASALARLVTEKEVGKFVYNKTRLSKAPEPYKAVVEIRWWSLQSDSQAKRRALENFYRKTLSGNARNEALYELGSLYLRGGKTEEGRNLLTTLYSRLDGGLWGGKALLALAESYSDDGQTNRALEYLHSVLDRFPNNPDMAAQSLYLLSKTYTWINNREEAVRTRQRLYDDYADSLWAQKLREES